MTTPCRSTAPPSRRSRIWPVSALDEAELAFQPANCHGILDWIEQLDEVDTDGVEPMTSRGAAGLPLREDVVTDGGDPEKVLANAPEAEAGFFVVPKVVE